MQRESKGFPATREITYCSGLILGAGWKEIAFMMVLNKNRKGII